MEFVLLGFDQSDTKRQFAFEGIGEGRLRTPVVVVADLSLAREHELKVQDLPMACLRLLETADPATLQSGLITLSGSHMAALSKARREAVEEKKPRRSRPAPAANLGKAWRAPMNLASAPKLP